MALISKEKKENGTVELIFNIDAQTFESAVEKAYRHKVKNIKINGYRPGHAPRSVIEKQYGKGVFYDDALNAILPNEYEQVEKSADLGKTVGNPEFDVDNIDPEKGVTMKATVTLYPEISIADYKGISVSRHEVEVDDDEIDHEIEHTRHKLAREIEIVDRPAQMGDTVTVNFVGVIDGQEFEGGKGEDYKLKLGSGNFIPGFEEQIVGHNAYENIDVNVKFPEDYHAKDLAGKDATFHTFFTKITREELPNIDDEFAKDNGFDNLDAYKKDIKAKIIEKKTTAEDRVVDNALSDALVAKVTANIPEAMYISATEDRLRDFDYSLRSQGLEMKQYMQYTRLTLDGLRGQFRPQAEHKVKLRLALEYIVTAEGITITDDEVDVEIAKMAEQYSMSVEEIKTKLPIEMVREDKSVEKAFDVVRQSAKVEILPPVKEDHNDHHHHHHDDE